MSNGSFDDLPDAFPEAYSLRCLKSDGGYDIRVNQLLWRAGFRRTNGPFWTIMYRGKKPTRTSCADINQRWDDDPESAKDLVRRLAALVGEEPDSEYLKLFK